MAPSASWSVKELHGNFQVIHVLFLPDSCQNQAAPPSETSTISAEIHRLPSFFVFKLIDCLWISVD